MQFPPFRLLEIVLVDSPLIGMLMVVGGFISFRWHARCWLRWRDEWKQARRIRKQLLKLGGSLEPQTLPRFLFERSLVPAYIFFTAILMWMCYADLGHLPGFWFFLAIWLVIPYGGYNGAIVRHRLNKFYLECHLGRLGQLTQSTNP